MNDLFQPKPDNETLVARVVNDEHGIEIGVYPVLYGMRVRAGFVGQGWTHLDWCCGSSQETLEWGYGAILHLLSKRLGSESPFDGIPTSSEIKPITLDTKFIGKVGELIDGCFDMPKLPPILDLRQRYFTFHPDQAVITKRLGGEA